MKGKILITDSLFIYKEHEDKLKEAGYEIERIDKPQASEDELVEALRDKVGYILGGIEKTTDKMIDAAVNLRAIVFTGIGYKDFIPNWEYATKKGVAIANIPDGPTHAVTEWSLTVTLAMTRNIFDLGRNGDKKFLTTKGIEGQKVGIIGLGRIGREIVSALKPFKPGPISYYSKHRHEDAEADLGIAYADMEKILSENDIVYACVSKDAGENFIGAKEFSLMKDGALFVTFIAGGVVDELALLAELKKGRIRAASDHPIADAASNELPISTWYCSNASCAFNTATGLKVSSDMTIDVILNLLKDGNDKNRVN